MRPAQKIIKNIFSLSLAEVAKNGIVFFYNAYLARVILPEGFGIIAFAGSFLLYFQLLVNLGFNTVGIREIAKSHENINKYVNNILTVRTILAVISFGLLGIITYFLDKPLEVKYVLLLSGFNLFSMALLTEWVYHGNERMEFLALRQVITSGLNLLGIVILVHSRNDVIIATVVTVASTALNTIWMMALYIKLYGKIKISFDFKLIKEITKSSIPIAFVNFFATILNTLNIIMLSIFRSDSETGMYNAAYKFLLLAVLPMAIIQNAFFPVLSRAETLEEKQRVTEKFSLLFFLMSSIVNIGFFTYSDLLMNTTFGNAYSTGTIIVQILMFTSMIMYISNTCTVPLVAWGKEKLVMYSVTAGGIVNIIINILLIPTYGTKGAAIGTIISESVVAMSLLTVFYKTTKRIYLIKFLKFSIYASLASYLGYYLSRHGLHISLSCGITLAVYVGLNLLFKSVDLKEIKGYFINDI